LDWPRETRWSLTDRWDGGDDFSYLELVQNGGLSRRIQTDLVENKIMSGAIKYEIEVIP
jgi:hypothetical protein